VIDHANQLTDDIFISSVELSSRGFIQLFAVNRKFNPDFRFRCLSSGFAQFVDEHRLISPAPPSLC
jgi:hypothetical protein